MITRSLFLVLDMMDSGALPKEGALCAQRRARPAATGSNPSLNLGYFPAKESLSVICRQRMLRKHRGEQDVSQLPVFGKARLVNRFYDESLAFHHTRRVFSKYPKVVALPEILDAVFLCNYGWILEGHQEIVLLGYCEDCITTRRQDSMHLLKRLLVIGHMLQDIEGDYHIEALIFYSSHIAHVNFEVGGGSQEISCYISRGLLANERREKLLWSKVQDFLVANNPVI